MVPGLKLWQVSRNGLMQKYRWHQIKEPFSWLMRPFLCKSSMELKCDKCYSIGHRWHAVPIAVGHLSFSGVIMVKLDGIMVIMFCLHEWAGGSVGSIPWWCNICSCYFHQPINTGYYLFLPVVHLMSCSEIYMYIFASSIQCFRGWVQNADYTPRTQDVYSARVQHVDVSYLKLRFGTCW